MKSQQKLAPIRIPPRNHPDSDPSSSSTPRSSVTSSVAISDTSWLSGVVTPLFSEFITLDGHGCSRQTKIESYILDHFSGVGICSGSVACDIVTIKQNQTKNRYIIELNNEI